MTAKIILSSTTLIATLVALYYMSKCQRLRSRLQDKSKVLKYFLNEGNSTPTQKEWKFTQYRSN